MSLGLSERSLSALSALEKRTVAADGGRLKLEWGTLRTRPGQQVDDLLWWDGDQLLGFLGLYSFDGRTVELAGMVDPAARRRGIATALLDAALPLGRERAYEKTLLVTSRGSEGGLRFALGRGAVFEHSEHALVGPPNDGPPVLNERALGLYTSVGFARVTTEDYYALPLSTLPPRGESPRSPRSRS